MENTNYSLKRFNEDKPTRSIWITQQIERSLLGVAL